MTVRMRHTKSHTRNRRSHHKAETATLSKDKETGTVHMRHRASSVTGKYKGRNVIDTTKKVEKKTAVKSKDNGASKKQEEAKGDK
jgi:large subunit ribosomal protein L32